MSNKVIIEIRGQVKERAGRLGLSEQDITRELDLVGSGLFNSMEFVEFITALESRFDVEIDYEEALDRGDFTKVSSIVDTFRNALGE